MKGIQELGLIDVKQDIEFENSRHDEQLFQQVQQAVRNQDVSWLGALLKQALDTYGPVYPLYLITLCYDEIVENYRKAGLDESVQTATLSDIRLWVETYAEQSAGRPGLTQVYWIARHLCAKIVRLGRLQYELKSFGFPYRIYRKRGSNGLLVLAESKVACDESGFIAHNDPHFVTRFEETAHRMRAHQVDTVAGCICHTYSEFDKSDLELLADSQTEVLHVHIPAEGTLEHALVEQSLEIARQHFPSHHLFVCSSWLLDPALEGVVPVSSNILSFMKRFHKFPVQYMTPQIYERVFGFNVPESAIPAFHARTSLQRSVQNALAAGRVFRTMGGFFLRD